MFFVFLYDSRCLLVSGLSQRSRGMPHEPSPSSPSRHPGQTPKSVCLLTQLLLWPTSSIGSINPSPSHRSWCQTNVAATKWPPFHNLGERSPLWGDYAINWINSPLSPRKYHRLLSFPPYRSRMFFGSWHYWAFRQWTRLDFLQPKLVKGSDGVSIDDVWG